MNPKDRKTTMSTGDFTLSAIGTPKMIIQTKMVTIHIPLVAI